jgi:two-component system cell cycle response regulator
MSSPTQATAKTRTGRRGQGRVLIVTDGTPSEVYQKSLEEAGLLVVGVARSFAALVALRRARPHIVIADADLKGVSADELARTLGRVEDNGVTLVLVGEMEANGERRARALKMGAFDYFQLPDELPLLILRVEQLVELRQTIERLRAEADRDYLTGLANRRRFRIALAQEVERWRRYNVPCGLVLVDIDHMKRINDTHGHSAGDTVIRHVASALTSLSRDNDTAARLGGEEFALLLAGADDRQAIAAAERVRQMVAAESLESIGRVTISLGVASCPVHATSERTLYAASDAALYRAKGEGRDRVAVALAVNLMPA